jgi:hypothetical protein
VYALINAEELDYLKNVDDMLKSEDPDVPAFS